jgi:hypothetical protein
MSILSDYKYNEYVKFNDEIFARSRGKAFVRFDNNERLEIKPIKIERDNDTNKLFKLVGIIMIGVLFGLVGWLEDSHGSNSWDVVHELYYGEFGVHNDTRNDLVEEYETILSLVEYTDNRIDNFDFCDYNLENRVRALLQLIDETDYAYESIMQVITIFVKNHIGI